ncbi:MAG: SPOR domain-containing protein [Gammaproteobacteria bacterium]|nr:SPOR domain-containing protein [Gammaproteobacteria bacterium]
MAKKRRRRKKQNDFPGWVWMLFGLGIGLSVAFAIYVNDRTPQQAGDATANQPRSLAEPVVSPTVDNNGETEQAAAAPKRFDFYEMLPKFEVIIPEQEPDVAADTEPRAVEQPGVYVLQAGSFSQFGDADRRRAELALHGIESRVQRVTIDDKTYHRVRIGPIDDLNELNLVRSRLRQAKIDVLRIRLGE